MPITKAVQKLEAYVPGEQPKIKGIVKLNTNENPYPPSPRCAKALAAFDLDRLRRYPDPVFAELRKALAVLNATGPENVFIGNGSDEVLAVAAKTFVEDGEKIGSLDPSYSLYKTLADIRGVPWKGFPLPEAKAAEKENVSLFLWTNPNAPTGEFVSKRKISAFAGKFRGVVIVDEAYADFAEENCMELAARRGNRNVIVMRTFSKSYSLAGLRVGYCVGPADLIGAMYKVKDSYNVDAVAQSVALAAVKDQRWMRRNAAKIVKTRTWFVSELESRGWDVLPSQANFVFARPPAGNAAEIFERLKKRRIFVRYFSGAKTAERLRITIGTDAEMKKLLKFI
ncbi:MAG: histidinol-phosphate transaminase [Kiritimatiellae bacterium]|nr:histidinol-phosphate transaminase [Kiritimatiellia bacterium]